MSYQVLARKWRPRNFTEMVGQEHVVRALSNALDSDRLHHAYLFTGTRGVGKTTLARIFAKSLNCETGVTSRPCGECSACREIDEGRFVDLLEVDAASKTGVDDTRELLDNVPYAPVRGRFKVYLIDEVHMFSGHSFNALLKTLEEPPPHVKFVLATTDPQKVPVTVLSRCLQFNLKRLPPDQIATQFRDILAAESVKFDEEALNTLALAADGSMRDGLSLLDQALAFGAGEVRAEEVRAMLGVVATDRLPEMVDAVHRGDAAAALQLVADMADFAPDFGGLLRDLVQLLQRVAVIQQVPDAGQSAWGQFEALQRLALALPPEDVQLYYQIALAGQRDLPLAPDERGGFEMLVLRMLAFRPDDSPSGLRDTGAATQATPRPAQQVERAAPKSPPRADASQRSAETPAAEPTAAGELSERAFDDWHALLPQLQLKGMAAQLANHATVNGWDGKRLGLSVASSCSSLLGSVAEEKLQAALHSYLGRPLTLQLSVGETDAETPAQRTLREQQAEQAAAEVDFSRDPVVLAAQEAFDAEIVPDSVRRID
jgi:DNA polymerase-3 subunit gamma/tau